MQSNQGCGEIKGGEIKGVERSRVQSNQGRGEIKGMSMRVVKEIWYT